MMRDIDEFICHFEGRLSVTLREINMKMTKTTIKESSQLVKHNFPLQTYSDGAAAAVSKDTQHQNKRLKTESTTSPTYSSVM